MTPVFQLFELSKTDKFKMADFLEMGFVFIVHS